MCGSNEPAKLTAGTALFGNAFTVVSVLGSGGGGTAYKAWHRRLQKHVVLKEIIHRASADDETYRIEAEALKSVKSPYLPQVYDYIAEDSRTYTVLEYLEGESFAALLKSGIRWSSGQTAVWYYQLASALAALHENQVCHCDIKPANIILGYSGNVCLIDFNTALVRGKNTGFVSTSRGYASPEQRELFERMSSDGGTAISPASVRKQELPESGESDNITKLSSVPENVRVPPLPKYPPVADKAYQPFQISYGIDWILSDIFSLGATMHHVLTGAQPTDSAREEPPAVKHRRKNGGIEGVIEKSMRINPTERYGSSLELIEAVSRCVKPARHFL